VYLPAMLMPRVDVADEEVLDRVRSVPVTGRRVVLERASCRKRSSYLRSSES
jgi:hypothetical protein